MMLNPIAYIKEARVELGKVVWPTRGETIRLTVIVLVVSIFIGSYIAGLDALFTKVAERYIIK